MATNKPMLDGDVSLAYPHGFYAPTPVKSSSVNVFINGKPVATQGDQYIGIHTLISDPKINHPAGSALNGSPTVFVNKKPVHRQGDQITCGDQAGLSSSVNVFVA